MSTPSSQLPPRFKSRVYANTVKNAAPRSPTFRRDTIDPVVTPRTRKRGSPMVLLLLVVAGIVAVFGAGNLPQLNTWFDDFTSTAHANNNVIADTIISAGPYILLAAIGLFLLLMLFLWRNAARRRESDN